MTKITKADESDYFKAELVNALRRGCMVKSIMAYMLQRGTTTKLAPYLPEECRYVNKVLRYASSFPSS